MSIPFYPPEAYSLLTTTVMGDTLIDASKQAEYLACTTWEQFFEVSETNTSAFISKYNFDQVWVEAEPYILKNPSAVLRYCIETKGVWEEGAMAILGPIDPLRMPDNIWLSVEYVRQVNRTRWLALEEAFLKAANQPNLAQYANVAFPVLANHVGAYLDVMNRQGEVVNPDLELYMITRGGLMDIIRYLRQWCRGSESWITGADPSREVFETRLVQGMNQRDPTLFDYAMTYAMDVLEQRWSEVDESVFYFPVHLSMSYVYTFWTQEEILSLLPRYPNVKQ